MEEIMDVEIKFGGKVAFVKVHAGDDPYDLAKDFVYEHNLKQSHVEVIATYINKSLEDFFEMQEQSRSSIGDQSPPSSVAVPIRSRLQQDEEQTAADRITSSLQNQQMSPPLKPYNDHEAMSNAIAGYDHREAIVADRSLPITTTAIRATSADPSNTGVRTDAIPVNEAGGRGGGGISYQHDSIYESYLQQHQPSQPLPHTTAVATAPTAGLPTPNRSRGNTWTAADNQQAAAMPPSLPAYPSHMLHHALSTAGHHPSTTATVDGPATSPQHAQHDHAHSVAGGSGLPPTSPSSSAAMPALTTASAQPAMLAASRHGTLTTPEFYLYGERHSVDSILEDIDSARYNKNDSTKSAQQQQQQLQLVQPSLRASISSHYSNHPTEDGNASNTAGPARTLRIRASSSPSMIPTTTSTATAATTLTTATNPTRPALLTSSTSSRSMRRISTPIQSMSAIYEDTAAGIGSIGIADSSHGQANDPLMRQADQLYQRWRQTSDGTIPDEDEEEDILLMEGILSQDVDDDQHHQPAIHQKQQQGEFEDEDEANMAAFYISQLQANRRTASGSQLLTKQPQQQQQTIVMKPVSHSLHLNQHAAFGGGGNGSQQASSQGGGGQQGEEEGNEHNNFTQLHRAKMIGKTTGERLHHTAAMMKYKKEMLQRKYAKEKEQELAAQKFQLNAKSQEIAKNIQRRVIVHPAAGSAGSNAAASASLAVAAEQANHAKNINHRLYYEGQYALSQKKQMEVDRQRRLIEGIQGGGVPEDFYRHWSCVKCGTFHSPPSHILAVKLKSSTKSVIGKKKKSEQAVAEVLAEEMQHWQGYFTCSSCGFQPSALPTAHQPMNIGLTFNPKTKKQVEKLRLELMEEHLETSSSNGQLEQSGAGGGAVSNVHEYLYQSGRQREQILHLNKELWDEMNYQLPFAPTIPVTSQQIIDHYRQAGATLQAADGDEQQLEDQEEVMSALSMSVRSQPVAGQDGHHHKKHPHHAAAAAGYGQAAHHHYNVRLAGPMLRDYLAKPAMERLVETKTRSFIEEAMLSDTYHHSFQPAATGLAASSLLPDNQLQAGPSTISNNPVDQQKQFIDKLVYQDPRSKQARQRSLEKKYLENDPITGQRRFQPKVPDLPAESSTGVHHHGPAAAGRSTTMDVYEKLRWKDEELKKKKASQAKAAIDKQLAELQSWQVKALPQSNDILEQSTSRNMEELYRLLLASTRLQQQPTTVQATQPTAQPAADQTMGQPAIQPSGQQPGAQPAPANAANANVTVDDIQQLSSNLQDWKDARLDLMAVTAELMINEVSTLLVDMKQVASQQWQQAKLKKDKSNKMLVKASHKDKVELMTSEDKATEKENSQQTAKEGDVDPVGKQDNEEQQPQEPATLLVSFAQFQALAVKCLRHRIAGVGRSYIYAPRKKPSEVLLALQQATRKEETFVPAIDSTSLEIMKQKGRSSHQQSELPIEDILLRDAARCQARRASAIQAQEEQLKKELVFKPQLYRPPKTVKPRYRGMPATAASVEEKTTDGKKAASKKGPSTTTAAAIADVEDGLFEGKLDVQCDDDEGEDDDDGQEEAEDEVEGGDMDTGIAIASTRQHQQQQAAASSSAHTIERAMMMRKLVTPRDVLDARYIAATTTGGTMVAASSCSNAPSRKVSAASLAAAVSGADKIAGELDDEVGEEEDEEEDLTVKKVKPQSSVGQKRMSEGGQSNHTYPNHSSLTTSPRSSLLSDAQLQQHQQQPVIEHEVAIHGELVGKDNADPAAANEEDEDDDQQVSSSGSASPTMQSMMDTSITMSTITQEQEQPTLLTTIMPGSGSQLTKEQQRQLDMFQAHAQVTMRKKTSMVLAPPPAAASSNTILSATGKTLYRRPSSSSASGMAAAAGIAAAATSAAASGKGGGKGERRRSSSHSQATAQARAAIPGLYHPALATAAATANQPPVPPTVSTGPGSGYLHRMVSSSSSSNVSVEPPSAMASNNNKRSAMMIANRSSGSSKSNNYFMIPATGGGSAGGGSSIHSMISGSQQGLANALLLPSSRPYSAASSGSGMVKAAAPPLPPPPLPCER